MESNINDQHEMYFLSFTRTRRVNQTVSNELRLLIIAALNHRKNFQKFKLYLIDGRIEKLPKGGNHRAKLTDEQKESLCGILEEDCSRTIQRICYLLFERHNIQIGRSIATIGFRLSVYIKNPLDNYRKA
ncbi:hypothetical protein RF11_07334 [Thelohanellus kitauei]|uniref:Uncharacterized protein n=1 Tax=Thelohanellus kitauei TaxID=669202 RepID=A0A0C2N1E6_THEKT|nr:hypothetical protein RF11_07334 [Thelohanellus kitauei]